VDLGNTIHIFKLLFGRYVSRPPICIGLMALLLLVIASGRPPRVERYYQGQGKAVLPWAGLLSFEAGLQRPDWP
jgi:hypothetical protein